MKKKLFNWFQKFKPKTADEDSIAIIGMAGRYPGVKNLDEFWVQLTKGWDGITEIPAERWDWRQYYSPEKNTFGKTCSKWGGFLTDVDKFDAMFFNISPREAAKVMNPEERLMLETVWGLLENGGYTPERLQKSSEGAVSVFIGTMWNEYPLLRESLEKSQGLYGLASISMIANRVSYYFNFHGQSLGLDTMCSSSLTAIHLACESLRRGDCRYAIAGGVNLTLHPSKYLLLSEWGFLSTNGQCRSFGEGGDGYVPSEGVGAILLKPIKQARQDGDKILGIIRSTAANHGGKVSSFGVLKSFAQMRKDSGKITQVRDPTSNFVLRDSLTVPNAAAQTALIKQALNSAKVTPEQINYIEAHGTGTKIGDPIEIVGLCNAFGDGVAKQSCPIGSIKSNVGHMEGAAGIVAMTKVLLQLQHKQLVPSIHAEKLNSFIDFAQTPFYVQRELSDWHPKNGELRRAGISSFGAGGSNVHVIVEEVSEPIISYKQHKPYYLLTFSAKHIDSLQQRIADLHEWLTKQVAATTPLEAIAYTLNAARVHFQQCRSAMIIGSVQELQQTLAQVKENKNPPNYLIPPSNFKKLKQPIATSILEVLIRKLQAKNISKESYRELLIAIGDMYVQGYSIDWDALHKDESYQKISLPTYPFLKKKCWHGSNILKEKSVPSKEPARYDSVMKLIDQPDDTEITIPKINESAPSTQKKIKLLNLELVQQEVLNDNAKQDILQQPPATVAKSHVAVDKTSLNTIIRKIVAEILFIDVAMINDTQTFQEMGVDSILGVEIVRKIKQELQIEFESTILYTHPTIEQLVKYISEQVIGTPVSSLENLTSESASEKVNYNELSIARQPWIRTLLIEQPNVDLFCFSCAGGGPSLFTGWRELLPKNMGLHLIELPGREKRYREPLEKNAERIVEEIGKAIIACQSKNYVFFAHSLGTVIAFYVAKYLQQQGAILPKIIFLSAFPGRENGMQSLSMLGENIQQLSDQDLLKRFDDLGINSIPLEVRNDHEMLQNYLNVLRTDLSLKFDTSFFSKLHSSEPLPNSFVIITGKDDSFAQVANMKFWKEYTAGQFFEKIFIGNHFYLVAAKKDVCAYISKMISTII